MFPPLDNLIVHFHTILRTPFRSPRSSRHFYVIHTLFGSSGNFEYKPIHYCIQTQNTKLTIENRNVQGFLSSNLENDFFSVNCDRKVEIIHPLVTFVLKPFPLRHLGKSQIQGLKNICVKYIRANIITKYANPLLTTSFSFHWALLARAFLTSESS